MTALKSGTQIFFTIKKLFFGRNYFTDEFVKCDISHHKQVTIQTLQVNIPIRQGKGGIGKLSCL